MHTCGGPVGCSSGLPFTQGPLGLESDSGLGAGERLTIIVTEVSSLFPRLRICGWY